MRAICSHCRAEYDFPGLEAIQQAVRIRCEKCDQIFEIPGTTSPAEAEPLDGLDDALLDVGPDLELEPVPESGPGLGESERRLPSAFHQLSASGMTLEAPGLSRDGSASATVAHQGAPEQEDEFQIEFERKMDSAEDAPDQPHVEVRDVLSHPSTVKSAAPAVGGNGSLGAETITDALPRVAKTKRAGPAARAQDPERSRKMPDDETGKPDDDLDSILNFEDEGQEGAGAEAPPAPKPAPPPRRPGVAAKGAKGRQGFQLLLTPKLLIMAGGAVVVVIGLVVTLWLLLHEGTAAQQWANAEAMQTIDPLTVARVFLRASEEPRDDVVLKSVFYGRQAQDVASAKVDSAGAEYDQFSIGPIGQGLKDKEPILNQKRGELATRQALLDKYEELQKMGDPDDTRIFIDSKRRELDAEQRRLENERQEASEDLKRLSNDIDQVNQRIAKAQALVKKYSNPKNELERAAYESNLTNVSLYKQDLEAKTKDYNQAKGGVDKKVADIETSHLPVIEGLQKVIGEKQQELTLLEALKSDNPQPLLELQAEVATLKSEVAAIEKEITTLKTEADRAQRSLSRTPGARSLLATGVVSRSRVDVKAKIALVDGSEKSGVVLCRYAVDAGGKKALGDWMVDGIK